MPRGKYDYYSSSSSDSEDDCDRRRHKKYIKCATNWSFKPAYLNTYSKKAQTLAVGDSVDFEFNQLSKNILHTPDTPQVTIQESGVYQYLAILTVDQPCQFTIFVNSLPIASTTSGNNTAGVNLVMSQLLEFNAGDIIELKNFTSAVNGGTVTISTSAGGAIPATSTNVDLSILKIDDLKCKYPEHEVCCKKNKKKCDKDDDDK